MKLFNWVQNKLKGKRENDVIKNYPPNKNQTQEIGTKKEEHNEWIHGILSIGTLFTKEYTKTDSDEVPNKDLTSEEVREIHKELHEFISNGSANNDQEMVGDQHFSSTVANNKAKGVHLDSTSMGKKNAIIGKKSLSFLLKKMFICGSPILTPSPSFKDPILSTPMTRMEKILRAILQKKIHPQGSCQTMPKKIYLKSTNIVITNHDEDLQDGDDEENEGKWVKDDTEYIVLEI